MLQKHVKQRYKWQDYHNILWLSIHIYIYIDSQATIKAIDSYIITGKVVSETKLILY